jgi:transposase
VPLLDADAIREDLHARDAVAVIPPKANRKAPAAFDKELAVECTFNLLKQGRRFATRYEKTSCSGTTAIPVFPPD